MPKNKEEAFLKAKELVAAGQSIKAASGQVGISDKTYYTYLKKAGAAKTKVKKTKKRPTFIDLPLKKEPNNVAVIVCSPDQLKDILAGLS